MTRPSGRWGTIRAVAPDRAGAVLPRFVVPGAKVCDLPHPTLDPPVGPRVVEGHDRARQLTGAEALVATLSVPRGVESRNARGNARGRGDARPEDRRADARRRTGGRHGGVRERTRRPGRGDEQPSDEKSAYYPHPSAKEGGRWPGTLPHHWILPSCVAQANPASVQHSEPRNSDKESSAGASGRQAGRGQRRAQFPARIARSRDVPVLGGSDRDYPGGLRAAEGDRPPHRLSSIDLREATHVARRVVVERERSRAHLDPTDVLRGVVVERGRTGAQLEPALLPR